MAALWDRLDALAGRVVERLHSELVAVQPLIEGEYTGGAIDPNRPPVDTKGCFAREFSTEDLRGQRLKGEFAGVGRVAAGASSLQIMSATYAAIGYEIRRGDRVTLSGRSGAPSYIVSVNHPIDGGDRLLILTAE